MVSVPIKVHDDQVSRRLNYALGAMWGTAYGVAARAGLRGWKSVATAHEPAAQPEPVRPLVATGPAFSR